MYKPFPFNIGDVAQLCGISVKGPKGKSEYTECPFCGRKKKLNLHYEKNQFRCAACGEGGSMLQLYSRLTGYNGSNGEITKHIKEELGINDDYSDSCNYSAQSQINNLTANFNVEDDLKVDFERMKKWDKTYKAFLSKLKLGDVHRKKLIYKREMSEKDIEKYGFKSVPLFGYKRICKDLIDEGIELSGVGGFYYDVDGWNIAINPKMTGYIIPVWNFFGMIEGLQIRLDRPFGNHKYHLVSSEDYQMGTKTPAVPFFVKGCRRNDTLVVTEGFFKAAIPNKIFGYNIMALFGVNNQKEFKRLIPYIKNAGYKYIIEAFDADFRNNKNVADAKDNFKNLVTENGFNHSKFEWDMKDGKGLDDFSISYLRKHM